MVFHSSDWAFEAAHIILQLVVYFNVRKHYPKQRSFAYLMLFLTAINVLAMATYIYPKTYWACLWTGRGIALVWLLWAIADVIELPIKQNWPMGMPPAVNVVLFFWYWPFSPDTTPEQLDLYRACGYGLAILLVFIGMVIAKHLQPLQFGLLAYLLGECSGAVSTWAFGGVAPHIQQFASMAGMLVLTVLASRIPSGEIPCHPPVSQRAQCAR